MTILFFPELWKKSNITPVYKKSKNRNFENNRSISLLPIFSKVFEKIIFNKMYTFLQDEQLLNPNKSGFRPSDLCINQLLSITHEISQSLDATPPLEVRLDFLDISKAFDKVWHEGILYKVNSIGISGKFYKLKLSF